MTPDQRPGCSGSETLSIITGLTIFTLGAGIALAERNSEGGVTCCALYIPAILLILRGLLPMLKRNSDNYPPVE